MTQNTCIDLKTGYVKNDRVQKEKCRKTCTDIQKDIHPGGHTDRKERRTGRQQATGSKADRHADRKTDRKKDRQTDSHTLKYLPVLYCSAAIQAGKLVGRQVGGRQ